MKYKMWGMFITMMCSVLLASCSGWEEKPEHVEEENGEIVLSVLAGQSTSDAGIEDMIDDFLEEEFPNVRLEWECVDWGESFDTQLRGRIAAGETPDIMIGKAQNVKSYAQEGILAQIELEQFSMMDLQAVETVTVNGNIYGMPYNAWYQGMIYNKDIFDSLGLDVPRTLGELDHVVAVCRGNDIVPFAMHLQENWKVANMTMQFLIEEVFVDQRDWGGKFRSGFVRFSDNESIQTALEQNQYICENTWSDAWTIDQYECDKRFAEGEAAMYLTGTWSLQSVDQYTNAARFGIFPYPLSERSRLIKEINMTFMMSSTSEHKQLIQEIFKKLVSDRELMQEILGFTQTYSIVDGIESGYQSNIQEDIDVYEETGSMVEADAGNSQLVWNFQSSLAVETMKWLKDEITLSEVLQYADEHAGESGK